MQNCPSIRPARRRRALRLTLVASSTVFIAAVVASTAVAADVSLPYRDMPGFFCRNWNAVGECTDFSYIHASAPRHQVIRTYGYAPARYQSTRVRTHSNYVAPAIYDPVAVPRRAWVPPAAYGGSYGYTGAITVRVTPEKHSVRRGDIVAFTVRIENNGWEHHVADVAAYLDEDMEFISATSNGRHDGAVTVRWPAVAVGPQNTRTLTVRVAMRRHASLGYHRLIAKTGAAADSGAINVGYAGDYPETIYFEEDSYLYGPGGLPRVRSNYYYPTDLRNYGPYGEYYGYCDPATYYCDY